MLSNMPAAMKKSPRLRTRVVLNVFLKKLTHYNEDQVQAYTVCNELYGTRV
jgi:hypothetical protein